MCGIFGIVQHRPGRTPDRERLELTARLLQHRGPDHHAVFSDDGIGFAQTRLALVDFNPRSNQPFWDRTGRYCLVYNGEIYDFRELRMAHRTRHSSWTTKRASRLTEKLASVRPSYRLLP